MKALIMKNRDIYLTDPTTRKLANQGVASVNDVNQSVLRYELETFVCDGQYEKGMAHILETYLKNIEQAQQPAVWVSGFYGSGKSHLVKMLGTLWLDTVFEDGATARGIANLPANIADALKELSTQAKRQGGLHAASGTLGSSATGSVRLALLSIILKSVGLPEQYHLARFVMWLQHEGILHQVKQDVEENGLDWEEELDDFYVSEELHEALMRAKPLLFTSVSSCVETLNNLYPFVKDVSSDDMLKLIRQALSREGKFPLTLFVLDEIQQYIGEDSQRSINVQEVVEACSKHFGGKVLFIGTGQTAVTGTANLRRLEGRFTVRVELSDADVDAVIRKVILAKKPEAKAPIAQNLQTNLGEISRHLAGSTLAHRQEDIAYFPQDYPILPVRRRFWENTLRILDQTGTDSQLRNQLSMVHKVVQTNLDQPLGSVVPADYLYFDLADKLLQSRILPRKVHETTLTWSRGNEDEQLMARAAGLVFLINKLNANNQEIGLRATLDTLADLMVEDLNLGSSSLRARLAQLMDEKLPGGARRYDLLVKVNDEYRIQTEESAAWNDEFLNQRVNLANETYRVESERDDRLHKKFSEVVKKLSLQQGNSKVSRDLSPIFDSRLPTDAQQKIYLWVRDGWSLDENSVRADARQAGNQAATIFVYIPKRSEDELRHQLIDFKAAHATLEKRGVPNTPEGIEARASMETIKQAAEGKLRELIDEAFSGARVFQGGGNEIIGNDLQSMIQEAAENALQRLYPQFYIADQAAWSKVLDKAQKGDPDALKAIGHEGEASTHPVCKAILGMVAGGKKGAEIQKHFEAAPYGWSGDAIDGAIQVLSVAGVLRAQDERGQVIEPKAIGRTAMKKLTFRMESATVSTPQRIQLRKLFQKLGLTPKQGEELSCVPEFLQKLKALAERAGGEAPKPDSPELHLLEDIRLSVGNEQLLALYNRREDISRWIEEWQSLAEQIEKRWPSWKTLKRLLHHVTRIDGAEFLAAQVEALEEQRQLLSEPDPIQPLISNLTQILRDALNDYDHAYQTAYSEGLTVLEQNPNWQALVPEQREQLMATQSLNTSARPIINVKSAEDVLNTLDRCSLLMFADRVAAIPGRFAQVATAAAKLTEPQAQVIMVPRRTLKSAEDLDLWINDVRQNLEQALAQGPIVIQ